MIYQCVEGPVTLTFNYDRVTFSKGQLVNSDHPIFRSHRLFLQVYDEEAINIAPQLSQIRPYPPDPRYLSQEDVIREIQSFGINPNPYDMFEHLAYKLSLLRKMSGRSYVTVLGPNGKPMWMEQYKMWKDQLEKESAIEHPVIEHPVIEQSNVIQPPQEKLKSTEEGGGSIAMVEHSVEKYDDIDQIIEQRMMNMVINRHHEVTIEKNKEEQKMDLVGSPFPFVIQSEDVEKKDITKVVYNQPFVGKVDYYKEFAYLSDTVPFCPVPLTEEEIEKLLETPKWPYVDIHVLENFYWARGMYNTGRSKRRRWDFVDGIRGIIEKEPEKGLIELNLLIKRYNEILKIEPDITKSTVKQLKSSLIHLSKFGIDASFDKNMHFGLVRNIVTRAFRLAKLGKQMMSKEDAYAFYEKIGHLTYIIEDSGPVDKEESSSKVIEETIPEVKEEVSPKVIDINNFSITIMDGISGKE